MVKRRIMLIFPSGFVSEPIVYNIGQQFNVVTNIRQASLTEEGGYIVVELIGEGNDIEAGIAWAISKGVRVDLISGEI
ncbi:MAG: NIL domain-containing protein [Dehalococcoidales bacterium]|nr:NIL domain-containing protein [Dehalococcoidales bacterium]